MSTFYLPTDSVRVYTYAEHACRSGEVAFVCYDDDAEGIARAESMGADWIEHAGCVADLHRDAIEQLEEPRYSDSAYVLRTARAIAETLAIYCD